MAQRMVIVKNMTRGNISIKKPQYNLNRQWSAYGQVMKIPFEILEEALWDGGVNNLFTAGYLAIEDLQDKIDLGLEPADATESVNILILDENKMKDIWNKPAPVFKKELEKYTKVQVDALIEYAINNNIVDTAKCVYIKELTNKDILKAIAQRQDIALAEKREAEAKKH